MKNQTYELVKRYYEAFNADDSQSLLNFLAEDIVHDINLGSRERGIDAFEKFMSTMRECYHERVRDLYIFVSDDGRRAASEFIVQGKYIKTFPGMPEAQGQTYTLNVGSFFQINNVNNGKFTRVRVYYNLHDWLKQIKDVTIL